MAPLLASFLIGVAVKIGVGLAASAAKNALDEANAKEALRAQESFGNLLKAQRPGGAARGFSLEARPLSRSVPSDLPGRIASVERLQVLALDAQARQSLPGPALSGSRQANAGVDAYRRLAVTAP